MSISRSEFEEIKARLNETKLHYHVDERGLAVKCYHNCISLLSNWRFWVGLTLGFPLEHLLWEKVWPFYVITNFLLK